MPPQPSGSEPSERARVARVAHADAPGLAARVRADHGEVAAEVHEPVLRAAPATQLGDAIHGVLLHVAAEVELHAGLRQHEERRAPAHLLPADERQQRIDLALRRERARLQVPGAAQDAGGDVEQAVALAEARVGVVEQVRRLGVHLDAGVVARTLVDARGEAVVAIARVLGLEPRHLGARGGERRLCLRTAVDPHFARAPHRLERDAVEPHRSRTGPTG